MDSRIPLVFTLTDSPQILAHFDSSRLKTLTDPDNKAEDEDGTPKEASQNDAHRSTKDFSVPFDPTKDSLSTAARDIAASTSRGGSKSVGSRRRSSGENRRRSRGGERSGGGTPRKMSSDAAGDGPSLEGIFQETDDDSSSDIFDVGAVTAPPSPDGDGGSERRRSSDSIGASRKLRKSSRPKSVERSIKRKSTSRDRPRRTPTDSPPRR
ncbi:unnamed protein product, partial [Hapterophycus canaliculatus]